MIIDVDSVLIDMIVRTFDRLDEWKAEVFLVIDVAVIVVLIILSSYRVFCSN